MVTIREIAQAVGVSASTVSRVLNYDPTLSVSDIKRKAILETAEALNYVARRYRPRALTPQITDDPAAPTSIVASGRVIIAQFLDVQSEMADPYYIGIRLGAEARARTARADTSTIYPLAGAVDTTLFDGAIGVIALGMRRDEDVDWVRQHHQNIVLADFAPDVELFDSATGNLRLAMHRLLAALVEAGYRRIAYLCNVNPWDPARSRYPAREPRTSAYEEWMRGHGLYDPTLCLTADRLCFESGYTLAQDLLRRPELPDVVVTANDNMAIGAYRAVLERGLSIPQDIAIASFNDIPAAQFLAPPLTTIRIPAERIGECAVDLLFERHDGRDYFKTVNISTEIIWRDSCRRPR